MLETIDVRRIEIDEDVYAELEKHVKGFEQPNDVLRRLLLKSAPSKPAASAGRMTLRGTRDMVELMRLGAIREGDELTHRQPRKGRSFTATVEPGGCIRTDVDVYREPSPALRDLVGSQIDGWKHWTHTRSGKTLRQLRYDNGLSGDGAP